MSFRLNTSITIFILLSGIANRASANGIQIDVRYLPIVGSNSILREIGSTFTYVLEPHVVRKFVRFDIVDTRISARDDREVVFDLPQPDEERVFASAYYGHSRILEMFKLGGTNLIFAEQARRVEIKTNDVKTMTYNQKLRIAVKKFTADGGTSDITLDLSDVPSGYRAREVRYGQDGKFFFILTPMNSEQTKDLVIAFNRDWNRDESFGKAGVYTSDRKVHDIRTREDGSRELLMETSRDGRRGFRLSNFKDGQALESRFLMLGKLPGLKAFWFDLADHNLLWGVQEIEGDQRLVTYRLDTTAVTIHEELIGKQSIITAQPSASKLTVVDTNDRSMHVSELDPSWQVIEDWQFIKDIGACTRSYLGMMIRILPPNEFRDN